MNAWPKDNHAEMCAFYGTHELNAFGKPSARWERRNLETIKVPYALALSWDTSQQVRSITCHSKVARSLLTIFDRIWEDLCGRDYARVIARRAHLYGGCYNFRPKRGLASLSTHAWGAAIDLDPEKNGLGKKWKSEIGMMDPDIVKVFEAEGWTWGGKWSRPDAMHFQATKG
jgi:hypothetical protein